MRDNAIVNDKDAYSISRRYSANISQYVFNIGSVRLPQAPVKINYSKDGLTESYAEITKAFASFNDLRYAGRVGTSCPALYT